MANENVRAFEEMMRTDAELQARLQEAAGAFEGDKADERALFDATIGKVAAEAGMPFSLDEALEELASGCPLSDDELDAVAGGTGYCIFLGGTDEIEAVCNTYTGQACVYVGYTG